MRLAPLFLACICLAGLLAWSTPARAFSMNIEHMTCTDLVSMDEEAIGIVLVWIDGYYSGKTGSTEFDPDSWEDLGEMVGTICEQNPQRRVMEAIDQVIRAIRGF